MKNDVMVLRDDLVTIELHVIDADAELPRVLALADKDVIRRIARFVHDGDCRAGHRQQMALEFLGKSMRGFDRIRSNDDVRNRLAFSYKFNGLSW